MNRTYFKSVRPDGIDFHTGKVHWIPADGEPIPEGGWLVEHPNPGDVGSWDAAFYLSAATVETDCTGFLWPARLLLVEPVGAMWTPYPDSFPHKRAARAWRVVEELPAWRLFGPQGREVAALIEHTAHLASAQIEGLTAARGAARDAVRDAARAGAWNAARWSVLDADRDVVLGLLAKDLISVEDFRTLTGPWESVMGPIEVPA